MFSAVCKSTSADLDKAGVSSYFEHKEENHAENLFCDVWHSETALLCDCKKHFA